MTSVKSLYSWLASGILIGGCLTLGVLATVPQSEADLFVYLGLSVGVLFLVSSFIAFLGLAIRRWLKNVLDTRTIRQALRQGIEVGILLVAGGWLWVLTGLSWWEAALLFLAVGFAELAFVFRRSHETGGMT